MKISKALTFSFLMSIFFGLNAQEVKTKVAELTAYKTESSIMRKGSASLMVGEQKITFVGLPAEFDLSTIQINTIPPVQILDIKNAQRIMEHDSLKSKSIVLEGKIQLKVEKITDQEAELDILTIEEKVLLQNTQFGGSESGLPNDRYQQNLAFMSQKLKSLRASKMQVKKELKSLRQDLNKLRFQQMRISLKRQKVDRIIEVQMDVPKNGNYKFEIKYLTQNTQWRPTYEIKVDRLTEPIQLKMKALLFQNTGEDWMDVRTELSTADPKRGNQLPTLNPLQLQFGIAYQSQNQTYYPPSSPNEYLDVLNGQLRDARTGEAIAFASIALFKNRQLIAGGTSELDGSFSIPNKQNADLMQISYLGYTALNLSLNRTQLYYALNMQAINSRLSEVDIEFESDAALMESSSIKVMEDAYIQNTPGRSYGYNKSKKEMSGKSLSLIQREETKLTYSIKRNQNIPSDGKEVSMPIRDFEVNAHFTHLAHPELDDKAYLFASIPNWEDLNLLDGDAGLYINDQYMGKTLINTRIVSDSLKIAMGRDERVSVKREPIKVDQKKSFLGSSIRELRQYKITIKNNKLDAVNIEVLDRIPLSTDAEIEVKVENLQEGKLNTATGIITWNKAVAPGATVEILFSYSVKYPKEKTINLPR